MFIKKPKSLKNREDWLLHSSEKHGIPRKGGGSVDSPALREKQFRKIYEYLCDKPRFRPHHVAKEMGLRPSSVRNRLMEAIEKEYIVGPQIRKKSFSNLRNYVNFVDCDDPAELYQRCAKDKNVVYHAILDGFCNFQVISKTPMNIKGSVLKGALPDYFVSRPPNHPWETSIGAMANIVSEFNPEDYIAKRYIKNHWNETVAWSKEHEILYQEFKFDLRKLLEPIARKYGIRISRIRNFLEQLPTYCIIFTGYYRESLSAYDECLYTFETDYEDFVIDVFSQLPATSWFYKVEDRLIARLQIESRPSRKESLQTKDVTGVQVLLLIKDMMKKGIVKDEAHGTFKCYWRKEVDDI
jgi:hypothetical protein